VLFLADAALKARFDEFLDKYYDKTISDLLISFPERRSLSVDMREVVKFDPELASDFIEKPDLLLDAANESLRSRLGDLDFNIYEPHIRVFGQSTNNPLVQDVGSSFIGKLILLDSLVVKRSEISPKVRIGAYVCTFCNSSVAVNLEKDEVPEVCPQCKRRSLKQNAEESRFVNLQKIAVQDPLEKLRGNTPTWQLEVWLEDDLVNTVIPGDRIALTGILRVRPRRNIRGKDTGLYTMFLDTVSTTQKQKEFAELEMTSEEERQIEELAKDPRIFEKIARSIAPSVYGHDEIKQAIALQLFGGTPGKLLVDGGLVRSDMHILLIGDPGSAKTRILVTVAKLVPKGIYVSGKSVTAGGLTAVAERDEFSEGGWTLKAGALVLGSGGVVSIDEFDKISDDDMAALHEALESQTISVAKAGIIATFNAKTAVLAAANPQYGRFDPNVYPADQFKIPVTLLSRFDLIFPIRDMMDEELDRNIAKHILIQHEAAGETIANIAVTEQVELPPLDSELLRKYIAYARKNVTPRLSREAADSIQEYYMALRKTGIRTHTPTITPRYIEGLVRMAEASAKTRLSPTVEKVDAERGISLIEFMLKTLAVDTSGRIDIDTIITGMPREKVDRMTTLLNIIKRLDSEDGYATQHKIIEEAGQLGIDSSSASKYIDELTRNGDVYSPKPGILKPVRHEEE